MRERVSDCIVEIEGENRRQKKVRGLEIVTLGVRERDEFGR